MVAYDLFIIEPVGPRYQALCTACGMYTYNDRDKLYGLILDHLEEYHFIPGLRLT